MTTDTTVHYEGLFLLGQAAAAELGAAVQHITDVIKKRGGEIVSLKKWDERRLAYEIEKQRRGTFILIYFTAPTGSMQEMERDFNLSETVLRQLIIRADHLTVDEMKAADAKEELDLEAMLRAAPASSES